MPLEVIESADPLADLIHFKTSAIYEMMMGLRVILEPPRSYRGWANDATNHLPDGFLDELATLYRPYRKGVAFLELAVDYHPHDDVPGFIEFVRNMPEMTFLFYILGRIVPLETLETIENDLRFDRIRDTVAEVNERYLMYCDDLPISVLIEDIAGFQHQLTDLWQAYWDAFFRSHLPLMRPHWENALQDRERYLRREGGKELMLSILGKFEHLPPPLPSNMAYEEILVIPVNLLPTHAYMFFGYGNVTVLFNSSMTEERQAELEVMKEESLNILRALSDNTRLRILQLIARYNGEVHGKKIAHMLDLSPSVVSRHLTQLKDSGVLLEEPQENRIIHYRLVEEAITDLPEKLLEYIHATR